MKMPEIAPTKTVMSGLGAAIAGLLVIGALGAFTVDSSGSGSKSKPAAAPKTGTPSSPGVAKPRPKGQVFIDTCALVTATEATAAFGSDAGAAHLVLGACLYDNGQHKLIVALIHDGALAQFNTDRGTASREVAGVGDKAYLREGRLRLLKGLNLVEITLFPADPAAGNPALVSLGKIVAARL